MQQFMVVTLAEDCEFLDGAAGEQVAIRVNDVSEFKDGAVYMRDYEVKVCVREKLMDMMAWTLPNRN